MLLQQEIDMLAARGLVSTVCRGQTFGVLVVSKNTPGMLWLVFITFGDVLSSLYTRCDTIIVSSSMQKTR